MVQRVLRPGPFGRPPLPGLSAPGGGGGSSFPEPIDLTGAADGQYLKRESGIWVPATITESDLTLSDVATANASTTEHGFLKKLPNDALLFMDGTGNWSAPAGGGGGGGGVGLYDAYLAYRDEKSSGTAGGTFTSGSWVTRDLNTEVSDTAAIGSFASNQITLPAGTYVIHATAPAFQVGQHRLRLYNVTDSAELLIGPSNYMAVGNYDVSIAELRGRFVLTGTKIIELQHRCSSTFATEGLGVATSLGTEVYALVELWRESTGGGLPSWLTFTAPPTTGWSWDNQGSSTLTSTASKQYLHAPSQAALHLTLRYRSAPGSTPYNCDFALMHGITGIEGQTSNRMAYVVAFRDAGGKILTFRFSVYDANYTVSVDKWNSATSYNVIYTGFINNGGAVIQVPRAPQWLRLRDDGTDLKFYYSADGEEWILFATHARGDFLTTAPNAIGFGAMPENGDCDVSLVHYAES